MAHILYVVPTPIGNLEDITLRALRILGEVRLIAAEDTRTTRVLLDHYDIHTPLTSYHEHNKLSKLDTLFETLETGDVALVSDAGTPGINDPGYELIDAALARGITVTVLPGASAVITALVASGLPTDEFVFLGFLPRKRKPLRDLLDSVSDESHTLIAYESPNRLQESLAVFGERLGSDRPIAVCRELSKLHEEVFRGTVQEALEHYTTHPPRGEVTLVIGGAVARVAERWDEERVRIELSKHIEQGESRSDAARQVAIDSGWERRVVYKLFNT